MASEKVLYRISFYNQGSVYVLCARYVSESQLFGYLELDEIVFSDDEKDSESSEAKLKEEFAGVRTTFIPSHAVIRIDEIADSKPGQIKKLTSGDGNVSHFPFNVDKGRTPKDKDID